MASSGGAFMLVAAIDFGTTFSGYAFSFVSSAKDPNRHEQIRTNKNWGASLGFQSSKTPTSVLTDRRGNFLAFGYEAEQKYCQALEDEDSDNSDDESGAGSSKPDMLLFRHFKMMLHKQDVKLKAVITAVDGTIKPAIDIFSHALQYLKDHMINEIKLQTGSKPRDEDVRWVITVPAIWGDSSKQFMREAATRASCITSKDSKKLKIALEPESASLCCRRLNLAHYDDEKDISFPKGTKYIVLDCGGGTIDITAHVVDSDEKVKEILSPSGGPWGGTKVDSNFTFFLEETLGKNFLNTYKQKCPHEWLTFLTSFEKIKKALKLGEKLCLALPWGMATVYSEMHKGKKIEKALKAADGVAFSSGMIAIKHEKAKTFFEPVIREIINHLREIMQKEELQDLSYIMMVGGFSECGILQLAVKEAFERNTVKVLIPSEAQLAIIKGAVLFGHQPDEIKERILAKTYGCAVDDDFDPLRHDPRRIFKKRTGKVTCKNVYRRIIEKGTPVQVGRKITHSFLTEYAREIVFRLFVTDTPLSSKVQYVDDPDIALVGSVSIVTTAAAKLELSLMFGTTEIEVEAKELYSGTTSTTQIDFLS